MRLVLEQHSHFYFLHSWQCCAYHGAEKFTWTFQRWICHLADDGPPANRYIWNHSWEPQQ